MKIGDLVHVHPACAGLYLIIDEVKKCDKENNDHDLFMLYGKTDNRWVCALMERQWIEVASESR